FEAVARRGSVKEASEARNAFIGGSRLLAMVEFHRQAPGGRRSGVVEYRACAKGNAEPVIATVKRS
ncbi:MAG: hypothetical protein AAGL66_15420, partial [Pseudomonadota bacterium]